MEHLGPHGLAVVVDMLDAIGLGSGGIQLVVTDRPQAVRAEVEARCPAGWMVKPLFSPEREQLSDAARRPRADRGVLLLDVIDPRQEHGALRVLNDHREQLLRRGTCAVVIVAGKDPRDADAAYLELQSRAPDFWSVRDRVHRVVGPDPERAMVDELLDMLSPRFAGDRAKARRWLDGRSMAEEWVAHRLWREGRQREEWLGRAVASEVTTYATMQEIIDDPLLEPRRHPLLDWSPIGEPIALERWPRPTLHSGSLDEEQQALVWELAVAFERDGMAELWVMPEDETPDRLVTSVMAWGVLESRYELVLHLDASMGLEKAIAQCLRQAGDSTPVDGLIDAARRLQGALGRARALLLITEVESTELQLLRDALSGRAIVSVVRGEPVAAFCVACTMDAREHAQWARDQLAAWSDVAAVKPIRARTALLDLREASSRARHVVALLGSTWDDWPNEAWRLLERVSHRVAVLTVGLGTLPVAASALAWHGELGSDEATARQQLLHATRALGGGTVEHAGRRGFPWPDSAPMSSIPSSNARRLQGTAGGDRERGAIEASLSGTERVAEATGRLSDGEQALIERIVGEEERPVVFLLGSALTIQPGPGLPGVPGTRGVVEMLREALGERPAPTLEEALANGDVGAAYRAGFAALVRRKGQDSANRVIRRAVLEAHDVLDESLQARVLAGHPDEHRGACQELLEHLDGWRPLRPSVAALGEILTAEQKRFPTVLTTNFDPLIEIAVRRADGSVRITVLARDGNPAQHRGSGTHVVYVHGYWLDADTLHTEVQLQKPRPQLQATLKRWIERSLLVVLGYGGWDDVLMDSLTALAADEGAYPDILWGFYGEKDTRIEHKLAPAGSRTQLYEHVDLHRLLPGLRDRLGVQRQEIHRRSPEWLGPPYQELPPTASNISLLQADYGVVRMSGREVLLDDFAAWCEGGGLGIRLVTGPGGHGKTRLLRELCKRQLERGWTAGILERSEEPDPRLLDMATAGRPILLALDYAETWGKDLETLLRKLAPHHKSPGGIRVVLAARGEAEWWQELPTAVKPLRDVLERFDAVHRLEPLEDVQASWADAVRGFSERKGTAAKPVEVPPIETLHAWMKEGVLALHVAALLAVDGDPPPADAGVEWLFDELLRRELKRYWRPVAERMVRDGVANLDEVLRTVACMGTLVGPLKQLDQARSLLSRTPGLKGMSDDKLDGLAGVFGELYPSVAGERFALPTVQPDRIGERLVATQLETEPLLANVAFEDGDESMAERALRVLGRAAQWQPSVLARIEDVVRRFPRVSVSAWIAVAAEEPWAAGLAERVEAAFGTLEALSPDEADALVRPLPMGSVALRGIAALLAVRAAEGVAALPSLGAATEDHLLHHARRAARKGLRLSQLGRQEEALLSTEDVVASYRELFQRRPDPAFLRGLATSLNNVGLMQSSLGRQEEALAASEEAVDCFRDLAEHSDEFLPELAGSLNNLGNRQSALGRQDDALASTEEATALYRKLAEVRPEAFQSDLAMTLHNLSNRQRELGKRESALLSIQEAVALRRELAEDRPDEFLPDLAMSLSSLGIMQGELGRREEALASTLEAVALWRELTKQRPDAFLPDLAGSLNNLGNRQLELGKREKALVSTQEAVTHYRELAEQRPEAFRAELAGSLINLGAIQIQLGKQRDALASTQAAVVLLRELVKGRPDVFRPRLAGSLSNLGNMQSLLGEQEDAIRSTQEAIAMQRELAKHRPDAFLPDLAMSLNNLGNMQSKLGQRKEALASTREAVTLFQHLFQRWPAAFEQRFRISIENYVQRLTELGRSLDTDPVVLSARSALQSKPT